DRPQAEQPAERLDVGGILSILPMSDERRDAVRGEPRIVETRFHVGIAREHHAAEDGAPMQRLLLPKPPKHRIRIGDHRRQLRVVVDRHRIHPVLSSTTCEVPSLRGPRWSGSLVASYCVTSPSAARLPAAPTTGRGRSAAGPAPPPAAPERWPR